MNERTKKMSLKTLGADATCIEKDTCYFFRGIPYSNIFLVGAMVVALTFIPVLLSIKYHRERSAK